MFVPEVTIAMHCIGGRNLSTQCEVIQFDQDLATPTYLPILSHNTLRKVAQLVEINSWEKMHLWHRIQAFQNLQCNLFLGYMLH